MSEQTGASCSHWVQVQWPYRGFDSGLWFHCCSLCGHITDQGGNAVKIVLADAVVVTPEVAATAAEACDSWAISCAVSARQEKSVGHHDVAEAAERRYAACKAAAAALRGEGF